MLVFQSCKTLPKSNQEINLPDFPYLPTEAIERQDNKVVIDLWYFDKLVDFAIEYNAVRRTFTNE